MKYRKWKYMGSQIARFMGPTWGPHGSCRPHVGPMLAPWTLLSGFEVFQPLYCRNACQISNQCGNSSKDNIAVSSLRSVGNGAVFNGGFAGNQWICVSVRTDWSLEFREMATCLILRNYTVAIDQIGRFSNRVTEALKGHRVVWKIEICYLIRMT